MTTSTIRNAILVCLLFFANIAHAATLTVVINGIEQQEGSIVIALYDSADAFDNNGKPARSLSASVDGEEVRVVLAGLETGPYGIKLYHDANGNGKLDRNIMGIPSENYGFSGNKGQFGPPPFADAVVVVSEGDANETTIRLR